MSKKFHFTLQDLDDMIIKELEQDTPDVAKEGQKPGIVERLLTQAKLRGKGQEANG